MNKEDVFIRIDGHADLVRDTSRSNMETECGLMLPVILRFAYKDSNLREITETGNPCEFTLWLPTRVVTLDEGQQKEGK